MYYSVSKDYNRLFDLITQGETIAAFVDFRFDKTMPRPMRDLCKVQRHGPYKIRIGVRGIAYGGLEGFNRKDGDEKELFAGQCKALNLEWINGINIICRPQITTTVSLTAKIAYKNNDDLCEQLNKIGVQKIISIQPCTPDRTDTNYWVEVYYEKYL